MLNAIVEGVFEFILELIFRIIVEVVCFYTGEVVLFIVTAGYKKARWNYYADETVTKWMIFSDLSTVVGFVFWIFTIGYVADII